MGSRFSSVLFLSFVACGTSGSDDSTIDGGVNPTGDGSNGADTTVATDTGTGTTDTGTTTESGADSGVQTLRFVAMGDVGKGNSGQAAVAAAIAKKCMVDGCDFVQLLGDNIYDSGVSSTMDAQWQTKFEMPYANINLDFYAVLGNHDYGGNGSGLEFNKGQFEVDYTNVSKKWKMPAKHWHRAVSGVEFFALDTNMIFLFQTGSQKTDTGNWIKASTATWKIALGHHPYLSNGPHGNAGAYDKLPTLGSEVKSFVESTLCGKVDLYLAGHDHDRQWMKATCQGTEFIVSGAGASTTSFEGNQATWFQDDQKIGFVYVKIVGKQLTAEFIDDQGMVQFSRTLTKM